MLRLRVLRLEGERTIGEKLTKGIKEPSEVLFEILVNVVAGRRCRKSQVVYLER